MIIDFHTHILPGMDDGSRNPEMSLEMLQALKEQKVDCVIAVPHFYLDDWTVSHFLEKRKTACEQVVGAANRALPWILPGAEVTFFSGISYFEEINDLCIEGTNLLLLELPFREWSRKDMREIEILIQRGIQPVIAHLDRYLQKREKINMLCDLPVYVQVNADSLLCWRTRRKVLNWVKYDMVQLLGSDCHNLQKRKPNLEAGRAVIEKKIGQFYLHRIDAFGRKILNPQE